MTWTTKELSPGNVLIEADIDGSGIIVVGSIVSKSNISRWYVEIMWAGPGGDYRADFADYIQALAYVQGVSDAHDRLP